MPWERQPPLTISRPPSRYLALLADGRYGPRGGSAALAQAAETPRRYRCDPREDRAVGPLVEDRILRIVATVKRMSRATARDIWEVEHQLSGASRSACDTAVAAAVARRLIVAGGKELHGTARAIVYVLPGDSR